MPNRNLLSFYSCERVQNDNIIFLFRNKERNKISINYSPPKHLITLARPKTSSVFSHFIVHQAPTYKDLLTALRTAAVLLGAGILSYLTSFMLVFTVIWPPCRTHFPTVLMLGLTLTLWQFWCIQCVSLVLFWAHQSCIHARGHCHVPAFLYTHDCP